MAAKREETARKVEKLLRQGKLDGAIEEYVKIVKAKPKDWATMNALGDLYMRNKQTDQAVTQYSRVADHFFHEGFYPKAAALYKKILKVKPSEDQARVQLAEVSVKLGLLVDAKGHWMDLQRQRRKRGDLRGAEEITIKLGELDSDDLDARWAGIRARMNADPVAAIGQLSELATDLGEQGRAKDALKALREVVGLDPTNLEHRAKLVRVCLANGDITGAQEYLTRDVVGDDPALMLALVEVELRGGRHEPAREVLERILALTPDARDQVTALGWALNETDVDAAFVCLDQVVRVTAAAADWDGAAALLQEFVARAPNHVPALVKLVEVCVDAGLEAPMYGAQGQLADAYLSQGLAAEARVIAEDLVTREPWERTHIDRLRQALVAVGEPDPDAFIAERLSAPVTNREDFTTLQEEAAHDVVSVASSRLEPDAPAEPVIPVVIEQGAVSVQFEPDAPAEPAFIEQDPDVPPAYVPESAGTPPTHVGEPPVGHGSINETSLDVYDLTAALDGAAPVSGEAQVDLTSVLDGTSPAESAPEPAAADPEPAPVSGEAQVDLMSMLGELESAESVPEPAAADPEPAPATPQPVYDSAPLGAVFESFREQVATGNVDEDIAGEQFQLGLTYRQMGMLDEAIEALEVAVRSPQFQFEAGLLLGRMCQEQGVSDKAVSWLELASQVPAPTVEDSRALMYELGEVLEAVGETARALAVFRELQAATGAYRDVMTRVERLSRVQSGG